MTLQGKTRKAELLYQRALTIQERNLGPEHPDVATILNNLGLFYLKQSKSTQAQPLFERALAIWKKTLGIDHPTCCGHFEQSSCRLFQAWQGG